MATLKRSIINIALTLVSFAFSSWFYEHYLMTYTHYISSDGVLFTLALNTIITLILTYFTFILMHLVYTKKITSLTVAVSYFIYFMILIYVILLKNISIQGYSFNPLSFISDFTSGSRFVPIMNLVMFITLGFLFRPSKENFILPFFGLLTIETAQYVFHLGIFNLGDVTLNLLSIGIGTMLHQTALRKWLSQHITQKIIKFS